jgi:hypothetical protein
MSRYDDPRVIEWAQQLNGRRKRALKQLKRLEAVERNSRTLDENRAWFRRKAAKLTEHGETVAAPELRQKRRRRKPGVHAGA